MIEPSTDLSPEVSDEDSISASEGEEEDEDEDADDGLVDLEDLGKVMKKRKNPESAGQPKVSMKKYNFKNKTHFIR